MLLASIFLAAWMLIDHGPESLCTWAATIADRNGIILVTDPASLCQEETVPWMVDGRVIILGSYLYVYYMTIPKDVGIGHIIYILGRPYAYLNGVKPIPVVISLREKI